MNHQNLAPERFTKKDLRRAEAAAHNLELAKRMAQEDAARAQFEYNVEDVVPQHDCVLAELIIEKAQGDPASRIIRPDIAGKAPIDRDKARVKILAVGEGRVTEYGVSVQQKFKVGQYIIPAPSGGQQLPDRADERVLIIFRPDEIMAVINQSTVQE
jgi:co-chaperonin GroES (HSP10)